MKIKLTGKNLEDIRPLLPRFGLEEVEEGFDIIICHGGDGALLGAEREWPNMLKFPLRDAATAPTCACHTLEERLKELAVSPLPVTELPKLEAVWQNHRITGINDIFIHNQICCGALRCNVRIDGEIYAREIVGDGVGVSTVHGSTAYFRSITRSIFRTGIGLAFNNAASEVSHIVLPEASLIEIEILRGPGQIIADNSPVSEIQEGTVVTLKLAPEKARVCGIENFMCPQCRRIRHCKNN